TLRVRAVLYDFAEPRYAAGHPDGRHAFVTDSATSEVVAVDVVRPRTLGRVRVGLWARHVTLDPSGQTLWAGQGTAARSLALGDGGRPLREVRVAASSHDACLAAI